MTCPDLLLVEDQPETRMVAEAILTQWGYHVITAADGIEAIKVLESHYIQLVIADWELPGLQGPELCQHIRSMPFAYYTYVILFTARDDQDSLIQGIETGADDFVHKPSSVAGYGELRARIRAGERILELQRILRQQKDEESLLRKQLEDVHRKLSAELESASKMQRRLIPGRSREPNGQAFDWRYIPSAELSGDMLGYFSIDNQTYGFFGIDVAGHGIATSILASSLGRVITTELSGQYPAASAKDRREGLPATCLDTLTESLNQRYLIDEDEDHHQYFTMALGTVDRSAKCFDLCIAGHPLPLLSSPDGDVRPVGITGFPVGLLRSATYQTASFNYTPGQRLFIYSDGIVECLNSGGEEFGEHRLSRHLSTHAIAPIAETLDNLSSVMENWNGSDSFADDISIAAIEFGV